MAAPFKTSEWVQMNDKLRRRILADGEKMMIVELVFQQGGGVPVHHHPHEQITSVISGELDFTYDGQHIRLSAGDYLVIPGNTPHSATALVEGTQVREAFSPPREDFRKA